MRKSKFTASPLPLVGPQVRDSVTASHDSLPRRAVLVDQAAMARAAAYMSAGSGWCSRQMIRIGRSPLCSW